MEHGGFFKKALGCRPALEPIIFASKLYFLSVNKGKNWMEFALNSYTKVAKFAGSHCHPAVLSGWAFFSAFPLK
jgi:hypothetical protein